MKVYAGMATCAGREECVKEAIASIEGQVDKLYLYDNTKRPDIGDAGKFEAARNLLYQDALYLCLDDDLIYPPNYVAEVKRWFDYNERKNNTPFDILTFHGRTLRNYPAKNYYTDPTTIRVRCLNESRGGDVQVGGTGVMAFKVGLMSNDFPKFERKDAADIAIAGYAKRKGLRIYAAPHKEGWIRHTDLIDVQDTIYFKANRYEITEYYNRMMR